VGVEGGGRLGRRSQLFTKQWAADVDLNASEIMPEKKPFGGLAVWLQRLVSQNT